ATSGNNWKWRLMPGQLQYEHCKYLKDLAELYRRLPEKKETEKEAAGDQEAGLMELKQICAVDLPEKADCDMMIQGSKGHK
ncbi:MAG: hypothetical protein II627_01335, partial [Lachnospiraceae bacterium]|nr:hypothetical protein [Lachnospiraceae bacterium]